MTSIDHIDWMSIKTLDEAKGKIITGKFTHDPQLEKIDLDKYNRILDFGCGIGRNLKYIVQNTKAYVYAYDFHNMIALAKSYLPKALYAQISWMYPPLSRCLINLGGIFERHSWKFDFVLASLVFQHIPEPYLREILYMLTQMMTKDSVMMVIDRGFLDIPWKKPTCEVISEYFEPEGPYMWNPK